MLILQLSDTRERILGQWSTASVHSKEEHPLPVEESQVYGLTLKGIDAEAQYELLIGDTDPGLTTRTSGSTNTELQQRYPEGTICWPFTHYFESARGRTTIILRLRSNNADPWRIVIQVPLYVVPTKIGEERYDAMTASLQRLCSGLLLDLIGKSSRSYENMLNHMGKSFRSAEMEFRQIEQVWECLAPLIQKLSASPVFITRRVVTKGLYWGDRSMSPTSLSRLSRQGFSLHSSQRPIRCQFARMVESVEIPEHTYILGFLMLLHERVVRCIKAINQHTQSIQRDRVFRDVSHGDGPTLYEQIDLPRIRRLNAARAKGLSLGSMISNVMRLPLFDGCKPCMGALGSHNFSQNDLYRAAFRIMKEFLEYGTLWLGDQADGDEAKIKLTSRLYEHWVFMSLINAFRHAGIQFATWVDYLRESLRSHFSLEFDRGLRFEGAIGGGRTLGITFEPWIASRKHAESKSLSVYRDGEVAAWCPDILIELIWNAVTRYAIVIDCKYSRVLNETAWGTRKYHKIRAIPSGAQIVKQIWLAHPADHRDIVPEDEAVNFTSNGIERPPDEQIMGTLGVKPDLDEKDENEVLSRFAYGTLAYFRQFPLTS